ncbi:TetR/AcrR family transcriptional regulator [Streptomyces bambusae]|uniref:ScbR family autoregulator-binding transcription factor n=1 Tax=Streptomyces bambusae TaxID=1550616 RepID=UPI001CFD31D3|nr:ScbR family autoregulator-binding transcription factor [Streptomyces bambusae]MCB5165711.1 TetR/AcrR family transcriptional regulator [Streptomyces bambusae]
MARQERALHTRRALIEAAAEVFHREGFEPTVLAAVSARAGVSTGALHFHFAGKGELAAAVEAVAAERLGRLTADGAGRLDPSGPCGPSGEDVLQALIDATHALARALEGDAVLRAGFSLSGSRGRRAPAVDLRGEWQQWVRAVLVRAGERGALAPGVTADDAAVPVVAATVGIEVLGRSGVRWLSTAVLTRFWALLLPNLAAEPVQARLAAGGTESAR